MKRKMLLGLMALVAVTAVLATWFYIRMNTAFFSHQVYWSDELNVQGVLVFTRKDFQPDSKQMVQYIKIRASKGSCRAVEGALSGNSYLNVDFAECETTAFNQKTQQASIAWENCVLQVAGTTVSFTCPGEKVGIVGDHIRLFYSQYGLFE